MKNNIRLDNSESSKKFKVNFLGCSEEIKWIVEDKSKVTNFSWATDIPMIEDDVISLVARGGRSRWHIENQTFNVLKNHGYGLDHNYGHGDENLSFNSVLMAMISFYVDQIFEIKNELFQKAKDACKRKSYLWDLTRAMYITMPFRDWEDLLNKVIKNRCPDTS